MAFAVIQRGCLIEHEAEGVAMHVIVMDLKDIIFPLILKGMLEMRKPTYVGRVKRQTS